MLNFTYSEIRVFLNNKKKMTQINRNNRGVRKNMFDQTFETLPLVPVAA